MSLWPGKLQTNVSWSEGGIKIIKIIKSKIWWIEEKYFEWNELVHGKIDGKKKNGVEKNTRKWME